MQFPAEHVSVGLLQPTPANLLQELGIPSCSLPAFACGASRHTPGPAPKHCVRRQTCMCRRSRAATTYVLLPSMPHHKPCRSKVPSRIVEDTKQAYLYIICRAATACSRSSHRGPCTSQESPDFIHTAQREGMAYGREAVGHGRWEGRERESILPTSSHNNKLI